MVVSKQTLLIFGVFILSILFRLQNFFLLPIDAHAMRQTDTESVMYYFATVDANPLHPQASLIRPQTNIHGYFFLEVPAYQYLVSLFYRVFGPSFIVARVFNLALFSLSFWLVYQVTKRLFSRQVSFWSTILYSFIPSSMFFFGHAIHPDLFAITMVLSSLYLLTTEKRKAFIVPVATILFAVAVGTRPFILMALPSLLVTLYLRKGKFWEYICLILGSLSVYGGWSLWQKQFPEADHSWQYWTLGGREALYTVAGLKHLLWRNVSGEVIGRAVSGLTGIGAIALVIKPWWKQLKKLSVEMKLFFFCFPWLAAIPVYWFIAPAGNASHQYYANVFVLPIIFLAAYGASFITFFSKVKYVQAALFAVLFAGVAYNGYRTSSYFYHDISREEYVKIAADIEKTVPVGEKIVYFAVNNSVPFSLAHRQGWMLGDRPADVGSNSEQVLGMRKYGVTYFVYAKNNYDIPDVELAKVAAESELVYESDQVKIYKTL